MVFAASGCEDYLSPTPETSLDAALAFDTKSRIVAQVNGLYDFMKSGQYLGGRYFVYNDIRCDNFIPKSSNLVTGYATWGHSVLGSTNEVQNLWSAVYAAVNAINVFLTDLEANWESGKITTLITEAEYNQYRSEALTLRAMCFFDLLTLYAQPYNKDNGASPGLPLRLTANKTGGNNDLARSTVAQTYDQILDDLNTAEPLSVLTYSTATLRTTRIHRNTIVAFKTRVLLHMNDFDGVMTEAAKIVPATAPFVAPTGVANALNPSFANIWVAYTSNESIFSMPFTTTDLPGTQNGLAHYNHPSSSESYYLNVAAGTAFANLDATDARRAIFQTGTVSGSTRYFVGKWTTYTSHIDYAPVLRYAEVLLNYAEAIVRDGDAVTQQAVDLLNAVRTRSFPAGDYELADFADVNAFITALMMERNMEFLGEGLRNLDLLRTMSTIPAKSSIAAIPPTQAEYIWPIPDSERASNKLMTGN